MPRAGITGKPYIKIDDKWVLLGIAHDFTFAMSFTEISIKNKKSDYEKFIKGLKTVPIDTEIDWEPEDECFQELLTTFHDRDAWIEMLFLDSSIDDPKASGFRGGFAVTKFERNEPIDDEMIGNVSLRLSANCPFEPEILDEPPTINP